MARAVLGAANMRWPALLSLLVVACGGKIADKSANASSQPTPAPSIDAGDAGPDDTSSYDPSAGAGKCGGKSGQQCPAGTTCMFLDGEESYPLWGVCVGPAKEGEPCGPPEYGGDPIVCGPGLYCPMGTCLKPGESNVPPETDLTNFKVTWWPGCGAAPGCASAILIDFDMSWSGVTYGDGMSVDNTAHTISLEYDVTPDNPAPPGSTPVHRQEKTGTAEVQLGVTYDVTIVDGHENVLYETKMTTTPPP